MRIEPAGLNELAPHPSRPWRAPLAVALLALLVFAPSLAIGFRLDDTFQIERNAAVRSFDLGAIFGRGYWANVSDPGFGFDPRSDLWRPLTTLSVACTHALFGLAPLPYHLENLLLHALSSALVVLLLRRWGRSELEALLAAALFAVAPVHIEPLGSVILRNELWAALFGLLYLLWDAERKPARACAALALALLAKESAIALPVAALLARRALLGDGARTALRAALPALGVALVYLGARFAVLGRLGIAVETAYFGPSVSTPEVWLTMARFAAEHYLPACLFGAPLVFDYSPQAYPTTTTSDALAWVLLLGFATIAAAAGHVAWHRRSYLGFALALFVVLLGPTSNLPTRIGVLGATRLLYLPYLGIACALAAGLAALARREALRRAALVAAALALVLLSLQTVRRLAVWIDDVDFYTDICAEAPRNALAQGMLGEAQFARIKAAVDARGDVETPARAAASAFAASIEIEPRNLERLGRQLGTSAAFGAAEEELLRGLDAALRARGAALPPLPTADALLERAGESATRAALASWIAAALPQSPAESALAALPFEDRARFVNAKVFVEALLLDQARCAELRLALRAAERALLAAESTSAEAPSAADARALCEAIERDARGLVELTGALASPRSGDPASLATYRRELRAIFAERYARYALALAQRAEALRRKLG
ncbi:MAG: hypothetical protein JNM84_08530 [Planctomycetes bacterium]|nr:hypothetical protein [Planctomycetota bacterium]